MSETTVTSADGTIISIDRQGEGPAVVLVTGGSVDRSSNAGLAALLATDFTVYNYDRRGRGESGDTAPYAVEREIEDLDAVIGAADGSASVYGTSSGAALAAAAAARGLAITNLALWEPPYIIDDRPRPPADTARIYRELVAAGRRGDAVEYFMAKVVGMPAEFVAGARNSPWWPAQEALAHTLAYDAEIMGDYTLPVDRYASIKARTIVLDGGASPAWMRNTARTVASVIPGAQHRTLEGQEHNVDPAAMAAALREFFAG
jgi:alpha-beta hydrolase superfamily lysophospholipase